MKSDSAPPPRLPPDLILGDETLAWKGLAHEIGRSREDRPILGFERGRGAARITLIGGCHADEPVGPALLERLAAFLARLPSNHPLLARFTWRIVAHVNPDGEERNRSWTRQTVEVADHAGQPDRGYDLATYLGSVVRELPGDDIEFGFPGGDEPADGEPRPENLAVARFLARPEDAASGRLAVHGSLHGMGLAPGPWFLLEQSWIERTVALRERLASAVENMGYRLFDAERNGEKGFHRIGPGFSTRPDSVAMRRFFRSRGEPEVARKFRPSSMEFARTQNREALTLVTEMPLFLVSSLPPGPVERRDLERARSDLGVALAAGLAELARSVQKLGVKPMPIRDQMRLQLLFLEEALEAAAPRRRRTSKRGDGSVPPNFRY